MTDREYTLTEFYRYLKLDIWRQGQVQGWGRIEKVRIPKEAAGEKIDFHAKSLKSYRSSSLVKKQLGLGLYLLDLIPVRKNEATGETVQLAVIAVCRHVLDKAEAVHCLKITGGAGFEEMKNALLSQQPVPPVRRRKSIYRKKPSKVRYENVPVNAYTRKY